MFRFSLKPEDPAPDFDLLDEVGVRHRLADYRGRWLALFFYPMDNSPLCLREACAFNEQWDQFQERGADVLGCSVQGAESHLKMRSACRLRYRLLCDVDRVMRKAWAVSPFPGLRRVTYLVDPLGRIRFVFRRQLRGEEHAARSLAFLRQAVAA